MLLLALALALNLACHGALEEDSGRTSTDGGASDGGASDGEGSDTAGPTDSADPCADVPLVNYSTFGAGFITANCQGCHASTAPERFGAPESVVFDTVEQVWTWSSRILQLVSACRRPGASPRTTPPACAGGWSAPSPAPEEFTPCAGLLR